jgi:hypothetical protein
MIELPLDVAADHRLEPRGHHRVVERGAALGLVERTAQGVARDRHATGGIHRGEAVEPMLAVAIERAAHVEQDRANHAPGQRITVS